MSWHHARKVGRYATGRYGETGCHAAHQRFAAAGGVAARDWPQECGLAACPQADDMAAACAAGVAGQQVGVPSTEGTCCTHRVRRGARARCRVPGDSGGVCFFRRSRKKRTPPQRGALLTLRCAVPRNNLRDPLHQVVKGNRLGNQVMVDTIIGQLRLNNHRVGAAERYANS